MWQVEPCSVVFRKCFEPVMYQVEEKMEQYPQTQPSVAGKYNGQGDNGKS